jgi:hypothetical protein
MKQCLQSSRNFCVNGNNARHGIFFSSHIGLHGLTNAYSGRPWAAADASRWTVAALGIGGGNRFGERGLGHGNAERDVAE